MNIQRILIFWALIFPLTSLCGEVLKGRVPDEIETVGGHALGLGNEGAAAIPGENSVRANPAMLPVEKIYRVSAGYHWPTYGRDFYRFGVVDAKTSPLAAGITYTESKKKFVPWDELQDPKERTSAYFDTRTKRRIALGVGQVFGSFSFGLGAQYFEVYQKNAQKFLDGTTFGGGLAFLLTPELRTSISVEHLASKELRDVAPKTERLGFAWTGTGGVFTIHLDGRRRERVPQEMPFDPESGPMLSAEGVNLGKPEELVTLSSSLKIQDVLRLLVGYGQSLDKTPRKQISGGVALVNDAYALSYSVSRPYLDETSGPLHQALHLGVGMAL